MAAQGSRESFGILCLTVDVLPRAEFPGQRFLVIPSGDGNSFEAHLRGELNAQMAKPSHPEDGDKVAGPRPLFRSALNVVIPAHMSGAASTVASSGDPCERCGGSE